MNLPWDQEAAKALRAAQAVLAPADIAWLEAAHAPAFPDPSAAMERTFGELLGSDAEPAFSTGIEPEAIGRMRRHEPHVGERAPAAGVATRPSSTSTPTSTPTPTSTSTPARRIARSPHARSSVSVRPHRPVARDDQFDPVHTHDVDATATASPVTGRPRTEPDAVPAARPEPVAKPGTTIPMERGTSLPGPSPRTQDHSNGIRPGRVAADAESFRDAVHREDAESFRDTARREDADSFRDTARHEDAESFRDTAHRDDAESFRDTPRHENAESFRDTARHDDDRHVIAHAGGASAPDRSRPAAARSTRLVTGLSELNNLFRSVVENQADDELEPETARPAARIEHADAAPRPADRHEVIRPEAVPAARWTGPGAEPGHETSFAAPSAHADRHVGPRAGTPAASVPSPIETPFASFADAASVLPDLAREDVLLDRLLDRFEERLREQAIRHLGFTGGLT